MPIVPLFGLGQQGKSATVTAQRHLNLYAEMQREPDKTTIAFYGTPGLSLLTTFGDTPVRGMLPVGDSLYCVHRGTFWEVNNAGVKVSRGALNTTAGRVSMAFNGTQIAIADGVNMYCYTISGAAFATVASGLFPNPVTVTYQDSYFIANFQGDQRFQISGQYDGLNWDALDFASAESSPDELVAVIADHGEITLCGEDTIEFWGNSGNQDFPYTNIRGATQEWGLAARWSLVKYNDSLAGLMKNRMGQVQVMMAVGHSLRKISTEELDSIINGYSSVADATAYSYMLGGHPMYQINFPSAGESWLFDGSTGLWSPLESGLDGARHRGEICVDYLNRPRVADYQNGNIYTLDPDVYTDNGTPIAREIVGKHFFQNYRRGEVFRLQVDFETGVGLISGQGELPQAMLQVSKDNGHTWGNEMWETIGAIGTYLTRVVWRRLGSARDWVFKIRVTDPVKVVITGASIDARPSNE